MTMEHNDLIEVDDLEAGDRVTIQFISTSGLRQERRSHEDLLVTEQMGKIAYLGSPYPDDLPEISLVLDPENDLWARQDGHQDKHYGMRAVITAVAE